MSDSLMEPPPPSQSSPPQKDKKTGSNKENQIFQDNILANNENTTQDQDEMRLKTLIPNQNIMSLQDESAQEDITDKAPRKESLMEGDFNCEEIEDSEEDIRRKINQKLIKNKNYFMDFMHLKQQGIPNQQAKIHQDQTSVTIDKRCRSETPSKMSATQVLYRAHQKLQGYRKESPSKLLEKHQQRHMKAKEVRAQIELSRKGWFEKIRIRQQIVKEKWEEMMAERKARLYERLEQAEERRESEIESLKRKAMQEIRKIDETNYIMKMTKNNMKLDFNNKMNETLERRNLILEEHKAKQQERHLKEEAVMKRKHELMKDLENKYRSNKEKREQADKRRNKMLEEKKRAAEESQKREMVLKRKHFLGDKMTDIMSFVSNSENIWELLGNERDWQDLGLDENDEILFNLIQQDHYQLQKLRLKRDSEILNRILNIDDQGKVSISQDNLYLIKMINAKGNDESPFSSEVDDTDEVSEKDVEEMKESSTNRYHHHSKPLTRISLEESKHDPSGYNTEGSDRSLDEVTKHHEEESDQHNDAVINDDDFKYMLYSQRLNMSMKRNILKKNLSEDLTWTDFLKNDQFLNKEHQSNPFRQSQFIMSFKSQHTKSLHSTPERKHEHEIPCESDNPVETQNSGNSSGKVSQAKGKKKNSKKSSNNNPSNPNNSSSSNLSEKSRLSSVVYPSQGKKNPTNTKGSVDYKALKAGSKIGLGSHLSSTHSLVNPQGIANSSFVSETPRDTTIKKNVLVENTEISSKKTTQRMHSSSVQESSGSFLLTNPTFSQAIGQQQNTDDLSTDKANDVNTPSFTGKQMTELITNVKPVPPSTNKIVLKKLSANASKLLYPIREQRLLLKRPGREGNFCKSRIIIKIDDLSLKQIGPINPSTDTVTSQIQSQSLQNQPVSATDPLLDATTKTDVIQSSSSKRSLQSTPTFHNRKQSSDTNNSASNNNLLLQPASEQASITPTSRLQQQHNKLQTSLITEGNSSGSNLNQLQTKKQPNIMINDNSPSPSKKETKLIAGKTEDNFILLPQSTAISQQALTTEQQTISSFSMNELGFKELVIKLLINENIQHIKSDDSQKTIALESVEADKLIDYLEQQDMHLKYCRLCELIIPDHCSAETHLQIKSHKRTRDDLGIKELEDIQNSILSFDSVPGEIDKELQLEKEKALKRKVKRLKAQMIQQAVSHETASYNPGKEFNSVNKKRFQILCLDLEKQVIPAIKDYESLEVTLKEIIKILDQRKPADLHLMRKLKFIPILIEICKRISVCHKNEFKPLGRVLEYVIKIINIFCGVKENRNYMLQTNRMLALTELLNWCLNRPTQLCYGISFLPLLFQILTSHVKHRAPYECQQMKEMYVEYLICSQIIVKIKTKFQIINGPLDLSEMMGQVPLFLLKSSTFLEAITSLISIDAKTRPFYDKSTKLPEHVLFVIQNTDSFGVIPMITTILLSRNLPFKPSAHHQPVAITKVLPQTILSLAIICIKIMNNIFRMDYRFTQQLLNDFEIQEQLYHLFNYLLVYTVETIDQNEDSKELLHETLLMIGYFTFNNEKNQQILCKGENTILQKLCNLPFPYFCDKKLKDILFPTLIQASYKNDRSLAIMDQEISIEMLVDYIQLNLKEELPKIVEEDNDYQSMSSLGHTNPGVDRKTNRSPSISSTNSSSCSQQMEMLNGNSPYIPLYMRYPKKLWKDAIAFYSKVLH